MRAPHLPRQREAENPASGDHEDVLLRDVTCLGSVLSRIMNELDPFFLGGDQTSSKCMVFIALQ